MKSFIKKWIKKIPIQFTTNQKYDFQTKKIISNVCNPNSICIDIGCHQGEILDLFLQFAPEAQHIGFEPIPQLYEKLQLKYKNRLCTINSTALSNQKGKTSFHFVKSNPAYSGFLKRKYKNENEQIEIIDVQTDLLDNIIPKNNKIDLIKIDVEGAELEVLEGAVQTIKNSKPIILFEHGLGASDYYNVTPKQIFYFFEQCNYHVSTMEQWLSKKNNLTLKEFESQFFNKINYFFIAYPQ